MPCGYAAGYAVQVVWGEALMEGRCDSLNEVAGIPVRCELPHAHGGAHRAEIDDTDIDPDFRYVVSWWPTEKTPDVEGAVT